MALEKWEFPHESGNVDTYGKGREVGDEMEGIRVRRLVKERVCTLKSMSVHIALPCVMMGSWSSPRPSQKSSSIHL